MHQCSNIVELYLECHFKDNLYPEAKADTEILSTAHTLSVTIDFKKHSCIFWRALWYLHLIYLDIKYTGTSHIHSGYTSWITALFLACKEFYTGTSNFARSWDDLLGYTEDELLELEKSTVTLHNMAKRQRTMLNQPVQSAHDINQAFSKWLSPLDMGTDSVVVKEVIYAKFQQVAMARKEVR